MGQLQKKEGGITCDKCPSSLYNDEIGRSSDCSACPAGFISEKQGSASCQACPLGQYGLTWQGSMYCDKCPRGFVREDVLPADGACKECPKGWYMGSIGQQECVQCSAGQLNAQTGQKDCQHCPIGWSRADGVNTDDDSACDECELGQHTDGNRGSTDCVQCEVGQYGDERGSCADCAAQTFQSTKGATTCKPCELGQEFVNKATECSKCDIGKYGITPGTCASCINETFSDSKGEIHCKVCASGSRPNEKFTACELVPWKVPKDCHPTLQYLDDSSSAIKMEWKCEACPLGGSCQGDIGMSGIRPKNGWWRIPWSQNQLEFKQCPFNGDCIGASDRSVENKEQLSNINGTMLNNHVDDSAHLDGCVNGTKGPLCSLCIAGYNRDINVCTECEDSVVPLRIALIIGVVVFLVILIKQCEKRVRSEWKRYRPVWKDVIRVININITFAQINSSLPSVIEVQWPHQWSTFVRHFSFVNIDIMSLVGARCISEFNYYLSFIIMIILPVGILLITFLRHQVAVRWMARNLNNMTEEDKEIKHREALHELFEITDKDHSGYVDPSELAAILSSLGWNVNWMMATTLLEKLGCQVNEQGLLVMTEVQFVKAMAGCEMTDLLRELQVRPSKRKTVLQKKKTEIKLAALKRTRSQQVILHQNHGKINTDQLVRWTLRNNIVSSSLSGATQLLMFAHTPVSRKVFEYFNCNSLSGKLMLRADYTIDCLSSEYYEFMPLVLLTLVCFTFALPAVMLLYLFLNRKDLYSTATHSKIGWLYAPFVRGAEFWNVHDILMKMFLTGMLIYVPPTYRSGIATLLGLIAVANLNFFQPHKSRVLFWLSQVSFVTTTSKYVISMLLTPSIEQNQDNMNKEFLGGLLIFFDIFFMISSVFAAIVSIYVVRTKIMKIRANQKKNQGKTQVVPSSETSGDGGADVSMWE